jgi:hypothetical protein
VDDAPEITVLQLPKFKAEATELIGTDGIEALAIYLIDYPDVGDVIPGSGGVRKLRWAAKGKGKRGGDALLRQERQGGSDRRREETTATNRRPSERSAIKCLRKLA